MSEARTSARAPDDTPMPLPAGFVTPLSSTTLSAMRPPTLLTFEMPAEELRRTVLATMAVPLMALGSGVSIMLLTMMPWPQGMEVFVPPPLVSSTVFASRVLLSASAPSTPMPS